MSAPGYWQNETSGRLRPVIERYLNRQPMSAEDGQIMRTYLRQWINAPGFVGVEVERLRESVDEITTVQDIDEWLNRADEAGVDPL